MSAPEGLIFAWWLGPDRAAAPDAVVLVVEVPLLRRWHWMD